MPGSITPMIHVPDVRAAAEWYRDLGFVLTGFHNLDGAWTWARLTMGDGAVMFGPGGLPSLAHRREIDLYIGVDDEFLGVCSRASRTGSRCSSRRATPSMARASSSSAT
ncbi:VOC family protein [Caulobacter segnis]